MPYQIVHSCAEERFDGSSEVECYRLGCEGAYTGRRGACSSIVARLFSRSLLSWENDGSYALNSLEVGRIDIIEAGHAVLVQPYQQDISRSGRRGGYVGRIALADEWVWTAARELTDVGKRRGLAPL